MSSGAGSSQDMTNRMKQNRSILASKKPKFRMQNRRIIKSTKQGSLNNQKVTTKHKNKVLEQIKQDLANKKRKNYYFLF